ncbi:MAG TPA: DNA-directed RNA polymerase subunit omega [Verrucomicrobiales bacterium]|jgi:DNA-directed RNA polymerase subunit omega|nr:DNA-directed RNA polymerase subunit omega [Verrucomicrobiales bacterium]
MSDDLTNIVAFPGTGIGPKSSSGKGSSNMRSDLVVAASKVIPEPPVLINLVSARVKQLNMGRSPLVRIDHRMGAADIALTEIIEGKISADTVGDEEEA